MFFLFIIVNYISQSKCKIIEGELRCQELLNYLTELNLELKVWLCEDATGLCGKVEYHSLTDQLVGLVLPLNDKTGMPKPFTFMARSVEDMKKYSKEPLSTLVYVVLAQPILPKAPPFLLQIYGTDNKFSAVDVKLRWNHTIMELQKYVLCFTFQ